jgi:hypothetical protein
LINYLETETKKEIPREDLEIFIHKGDRIIENDQITLNKIKEKENKGYKYEGSYKLILPVSIRENAEILDNLLKEIKIADPAVGSGAFPLGMINEIVRARKVLNIYFNNNVSDYKLKKYTITHSIYGVDLDPGAVEIAKLRLWLALVVDEKNPHPLPNLEHKIMQGNSLISEYEGIKLFDQSFIEGVKDKEKEEEQIKEKISQLQKEYFKLYEEKDLNKLKDIEIKKEIKSLQKRLKNLEKDKTIKGKIIGLFDKTNKQQISQEKAKLLQKKTEEFINESRPTKKQDLKKEIDDLKWELIETTLEEQDKLSEKKLKELRNYRKTKTKPFFIWQLEFCDVFIEKGGFDVVIGNPPYVQLQNKEKIPLEMQKALEKQNFETFMKTGDIYCLFYEFGNQILHKKGHLAFITSNKWMRAGYGEKMRKYLAENITPKLLIDLGPGVFETATVDTNILLFQKNKKEKSCLACQVKENLAKNKIRLEDYIAKNKVELNRFSSDAWIILNPIEMKIKEKIEKIGTPLKDWDVKINRGILTGFNEAFIITGEKKDELIAKDPKSAEIIKPILRGKDIKRYKAEFVDLWLITTHNGYKKEKGGKIKAINVKDYPAIKEWLDGYWKKISKRQDRGKTPYNLRNCAYYEEFDKEKVLWGNINYEANFSFDKGSFINAPANLLTSSSANPRYFTAVMNSKIFSWEFENLGIPLGRAFEWKKQYVEKIHIPNISLEAQKPFIEIVDQILEITSAPDYNPKNPPAKQKELESQIDQLVYKLYDLTKEEIKIVEEN